MRENCFEIETITTRDGNICRNDSQLFVKLYNKLGSELFNYTLKALAIFFVFASF